MKTPTVKVILFLAALVVNTECQLPTSKTCEVYDPNCQSANCPKFEQCPSRSYKISHCFALVSDTPKGQKVIRKGCWLQNLLLCPLNDKCKATKTSRHPLRFCCCTGDNCNSKIL